MSLPENYSLTARTSGDEGFTDIELRTPTEKYTVATVDDQFAPLFLAAPDLLEACKAMVKLFEKWKSGIFAGHGLTWEVEPPAIRAARKAIAKAEGKAQQ